MVRLQVAKSFFGLLLLFAAFAGSVLGQTASATISGRVTDSGGAVIVGATVELTKLGATAFDPVMVSCE